MLPFPSFSNNGLFRISKAYPAKHRQRWFLFSPWMKELRLVFYVLTLYAVFITWGYLQEKIASKQYTIVYHYDGVMNTWNHPFVLNVFMSISCCITATLVDGLLQARHQPPERHDVSFSAFWKVAISSAVASPIGYEALKYISFPMMILSKSSKHVPVMFVGKVFYGKQYAWYKYLCVGMVCTGISVFTLAKSSAANHDDLAPSVDKASLLTTLYGLLLVMINLSLDGITSNEQDRLFAKQGTTSLQMMKHTNLWQAFYLAVYLLINFFLNGQESGVYKAGLLLLACPEIRYDIASFCFCACLGQILLFGLIREFGSLVWITVSVTRQLFTILLSVFLFKHPVNNLQWSAVVLVFGGLGAEIFFSYRSRPAVKADPAPLSPASAEEDTATAPTDEDPRSIALRKMRSESEDSTWEDMLESVSMKHRSEKVKLS